MEISLDEFRHGFEIVAHVGAERGVVEGFQLCDDAVDHGGAEDAILFIDGALGLQAVGGGGAAVGQCRQAVEQGFVLLAVDVDVDIRLVGDFQPIGQAEAVASGDGEAGQEEIDVGGGVRRTHFDGLFLACVVFAVVFQRVGLLAEIVLAGPAERDADKAGAVAVAPADVRGGLLMGHEAEIRRGVHVAESRDGRRKFHHAGDETSGGFGDDAVLQHLVDAVLHDAHVDVHAGTGLARRDFRRERDVVAVFEGEVADDPFGDGQLVGGVFRGAGEEFDFILLVGHAVQIEVADFRMAVFDEAARLGDVEHAPLAEFVEFRVGGGFVVAALVGGGEERRFRGDDVVFKFAHGLEFHAGLFLELLAGLVEREFGGAGQRFAVFVVERAKHAERGQFREGIDESRAEFRHDIEVAAAGLDEGEEAGAVDAFAAGEDFIQIFGVVDDEIQCLQTSVSGGIHEIDMLDLVVADESDDVVLGELGTGLLELFDQGVAVHVDVVAGHWSPLEW